MYKLLLKLLLLPPELLKVHAQGYADLAAQSWAAHLSVLRNRYLFYALSALCVVLALILGGVALLLWAAFPMLDAPHLWVLPVLPMSLGVLALVCWARARCLRTRPVLRDIRQQIQLDIQAFKEAQTS